MANNAEIHSILQQQLKEKVSAKFGLVEKQDTDTDTNTKILQKMWTCDFDCRRNSYNPVRGRKRQSNNS